MTITFGIQFQTRNWIMFYSSAKTCCGGGKGRSSCTHDKGGRERTFEKSIFVRITMLLFQKQTRFINPIRNINTLTYSVTQ